LGTVAERNEDLGDCGEVTISGAPAATMTNQRGSFSFSLASLLASVSAISIGCAALAFPTQLWASVISSLTLLVLSLALIAAIILRGHACAFWGGFAFLGWLFIVIEFVQVPTINFDKENLLPNLVAHEIGRWRYPGSSNWYFDYMFRLLSALVLGWFGGLFARWCYCRQTASEQ
jgi:hypothetical protein